jgi:hypothetical protein
VFVPTIGPQISHPNLFLLLGNLISEQIHQVSKARHHPRPKHTNLTRLTTIADDRSRPPCFADLADWVLVGTPNGAASLSVGIDGWDNDTVEQTRTESQSEHPPNGLSMATAGFPTSMPYAFVRTAPMAVPETPRRMRRPPGIIGAFGNRVQVSVLGHSNVDETVPSYLSLDGTSFTVTYSKP